MRQLVLSSIILGVNYAEGRSSDRMKKRQKKTKTANSDGLGEPECSPQVLFIWETWT
jgi:hypothetical protein